MRTKKCTTSENLIFLSSDYINAEDSSYHNVKIENITFDFAYEKNERYMPITIQLLEVD